MRTQVNSSAEAGSIVRRVREDAELSRSALAAEAKVSPRTLFAFERGCNDNIGLASFIRMLSALDLTLSVDDGKGGGAQAASAGASDSAAFHGNWEELGEAWRLDGDEQ